MAKASWRKLESSCAATTVNQQGWNRNIFHDPPPQEKEDSCRMSAEATCTLTAHHPCRGALRVFMHVKWQQNAVIASSQFTRD